jgi:hypothetical protein
MGQSSYKKGNRFMLAVSRLLSTWWCGTPPNAAAAVLPFRPRSTSIMPVEGHWQGEGDILHRPGLKPAFPFAVECKDHEEGKLDAVLEAPNWPVWAWWEQTEKQAKAVALRPMLVFSRRHRDTYVMLDRPTAQLIELGPAHLPVLWIRGRHDVALCVWRDLTRIRPGEVVERLGKRSRRGPRNA